MAQSMTSGSMNQATLEPTTQQVSRETLSRDELIQLVQTIMDYGRIDDSTWIEHAHQWIDRFETDYPQAGLLAVLRQQIADPQVEGYIFWPRLHTDPPKVMTPTEIIDKALAYEE